MQQWRPVHKKDTPLLEQFIRDNEPLSCSFAYHLIDNGTLEVRSQVGTYIAFDKDNEQETQSSIISAAIVFAKSGLCLPLLSTISIPDATPAQARTILGRMLDKHRPTQIMGRMADIAQLTQELRAGIRITIPYTFMRYAGGLLHAQRALERIKEQFLPLGIIVRKVRDEDLEQLFELEKGYQYEEVLTPIHVFNSDLCLTNLKHAAKKEIIFALEKNGRLLAKAGTNARGICADQIGGVYTLPNYRGKGYARYLMLTLVVYILSNSRTACLFVKPPNLPALHLYRSIGFESIESFGIVYCDQQDAR